MWKKWKIKEIRIIIAKNVYNVLVCRIVMGFTEHESLVIKSHWSNHMEVSY